jgi:hypothetical protein
MYTIVVYINIIMLLLLMHYYKAITYGGAAAANNNNAYANFEQQLVRAISSSYSSLLPGIDLLLLATLQQLLLSGYISHHKIIIQG